MEQERPVTPEELKQAIRNIPDFPEPGIQFKDITPVLADGRLFRGCIHLLKGEFQPGMVDSIIGIDARGFILGGALAYELGAGFVPIRKKGKLPYTTYEQDYQLEYGTGTIAIHTDAIAPGQRVLLLDDLLATGGTAAAATTLLTKLGADLLEVTIFVELSFLSGRDKLSAEIPTRSVITL